MGNGELLVNEGAEALGNSAPGVCTPIWPSSQWASLVTHPGTSQGQTCLTAERAASEALRPPPPSLTIRPAFLHPATKHSVQQNSDMGVEEIGDTHEVSMGVTFEVSSVGAVAGQRGRASFGC